MGNIQMMGCICVINLVNIIPSNEYTFFSYSFFPLLLLVLLGTAVSSWLLVPLECDVGSRSRCWRYGWGSSLTLIYTSFFMLWCCWIEGRNCWAANVYSTHISTNSNRLKAFIVVEWSWWWWWILPPPPPPLLTQSDTIVVIHSRKCHR